MKFPRCKADESSCPAHMSEACGDAYPRVRRVFPRSEMYAFFRPRVQPTRFSPRALLRRVRLRDLRCFPGWHREGHESVESATEGSRRASPTRGRRMVFGRNKRLAQTVQASYQTRPSYRSGTAGRRTGAWDVAQHISSSGMDVMKYAVVIEPTGTGFSAYVPDLPGCISTGTTLAEIESGIVEAITLHLQGMRIDGDLIPEPKTVAEMIAVEAA